MLPGNKPREAAKGSSGKHILLLTKSAVTLETLLVKNLSGSDLGTTLWLIISVEEY